MTIPGGFVAGDILGAADLNSFGGPQLGYVLVTSAQNGIGNTVTDITSLTRTWTAVSSRLYRVSFQVSIDVNWTSGIMQPYVQITDGSNTVKQSCALSRYTSDTNALALCGSIVETGLSGSVTRKLRASAGHDGETTGDIDILASSTQPSYILVEDIGPA